MSLRFQVRNLSQATLLGHSVELAATARDRRRGLLRRSSLNPGEGIWIVPCEAVHTFFMKFAIDAVYIDRAKRVRKVVNSLQPWRFSACIAAHSVIELPAGTAVSTGTRRGDQLELTRQAA